MQRLGLLLRLLEAFDDGGAKEGFPLHGDPIQNWPGQVSVEVDLTSRVGLVHSIPCRPHSRLHIKAAMRPYQLMRISLVLLCFLEVHVPVISNCCQ